MAHNPNILVNPQLPSPPPCAQRLRCIFLACHGKCRMGTLCQHRTQDHMYTRQASSTELPTYPQSSFPLPSISLSLSLPLSVRLSRSLPCVSLCSPGSLCVPGWPRTQNGLPASALQVLAAKVCTTAPRPRLHFNHTKGPVIKFLLVQ